MSTHSRPSSLTEIEQDDAFALQQLRENVSSDNFSTERATENDSLSSLSRRSSTSTGESMHRTLFRSTSDPIPNVNEAHLTRSADDYLVRSGIIPEEKASLKPTRMQRLKDVWVWEILGLLLSMANIVAVAIVLAVLNNKALSSWKMPISPNALVSVFASVSKSAFILPITECIGQFKWLYYSKSGRRLQELQSFDDASRGPLGSLLFLWHFKAKPEVMITCCACIIMVAALAVDPFTQQIIDYPLRSIPFGDTTTATTSAARIYNTGLGLFYGNRLARFVDIWMQAAIFDGLYGISSNPTFHCSSGNCTWPDITTLGVCGSCVNVTSQTKRNGCDEAVRGMNICNFTTPGGINVSASSATGPRGSYWTLLNSSSSRTDSDKDTVARIIQFGYLKANGPPTKSLEMPHLEISDCEIYLCAKRYFGFRVRNGKLETGTSISAPVHYVSDPDNSWTVGNTAVIELQAPDSWTGNKSFIININDLESTASLLSTLVSTDLMQQNGYNYPTTQFDIAKILYEVDNITQTVENIAMSMTNTIRQSQNSTQVIGQAFRDETFIRVRWPWFILPATLVFLTALMLQTTIVINRRCKAVLWKSSILPLLHHGLDLPGDAPMEKLSQVEAKTAAVTAQLRTTEGNNYRFVLS